MTKLIQCVPNFSEGRDPEVVQQILAEIQSVPEVSLLDYSLDSDHHRSVVTFVGPPEAVIKAAFLATKKAAELIDLRTHQGEHPRMGATDVVPLIPISGVTMKETVEYSKQLAAQIGSKLQIPVFLYERSASASHRTNLAKIRKGEYEQMDEKLQQDQWQPDYGPQKKHPQAGVIAVGARAPLVAFNVNLDTDNLEIAQKIAKTVRASGGGFTHCKALGMEIKERHIVQVSMNLVDYSKTSIHHVFDFISREAQRYGVTVLSSEIIGLVPLQALLNSAIYYLKLDDFDPNQVLEKRLYE